MTPEKYELELKKLEAYEKRTAVFEKLVAIIDAATEAQALEDAYRGYNTKKR